MDNILISACLLGINCKYNGSNNYIKEVEELKKYYNLIPVCPEILGGLSVPRDPSEINENKVISINGKDNTKAYHLGAKQALDIAKNNNCKFIILKDKSPSCGMMSYDGTFSHKLIDQKGITTKLLLENGFRVYTENDINYILKKKI